MKHACVWLTGIVLCLAGCERNLYWHEDVRTLVKDRRFLAVEDFDRGSSVSRPVRRGEIIRVTAAREYFDLFSGRSAAFVVSESRPDEKRWVLGRIPRHDHDAGAELQSQWVDLDADEPAPLVILPRTPRDWIDFSTGIPSAPNATGSQLTQAMTDEDWVVRHYAIVEWARRARAGDDSAIPALARALNDDIYHNRQVAFRALKDVGPRASSLVDAVMEVYRKYHYEEHSDEVEELLIAIGPAAIPAVTALLSEIDPDRNIAFHLPEGVVFSFIVAHPQACRPLFPTLERRYHADSWPSMDHVSAMAAIDYNAMIGFMLPAFSDPKHQLHEKVARDLPWIVADRFSAGLPTGAELKIVVNALIAQWRADPKRRPAIAWYLADFSTFAPDQIIPILEEQLRALAQWETDTRSRYESAITRARRAQSTSRPSS